MRHMKTIMIRIEFGLISQCDGMRHMEGMRIIWVSRSRSKIPLPSKDRHRFLVCNLSHFLHDLNSLGRPSRTGEPFIRNERAR